MRVLLQVHVMVVVIAALAGLVLGSRFIDPAILGAVLGLGAGLGGGAFIAAIATGTNLAGGGGTTGTGSGPSIWDDEEPASRHEPPATNGRPE